MRLLLFAVCVVLVCASADAWFGRRQGGGRGGGRGGGNGRVRTAVDRTREAVQGAGDMYRAYSDMREANWKNSDKYFHARGNYDAAQRGPGGKWAAKVISDAREGIQSAFRGQSEADRRADQEANLWGRNGGDPNRYRPEGLPDRY
ncbi:PREDICTED: serum amyloid A-5 protein-like isoform X3 [Branchiostoma belcheri]|uniref:Serum amyloid A-5 protein-like isoform X3 n=1 Tax=Branchiostoma belcheri TaxID=7741 RepID=A0A6P4Y3J3_BRABE|nr:PREDICTED: serum amyloid A-5 protein-like isoform X3 [Branchiostoma belcheri]